MHVLKGAVAGNYRADINASRRVTILCASSSHRKHLKQSLMEWGDKVVVAGDWSSGMAFIASGKR